MRRREEIEERLQDRMLALEAVGQVMKVAAAPSEPASFVCEPRPDYSEATDRDEGNMG